MIKSRKCDEWGKIESTGSIIPGSYCWAFQVFCLVSSRAGVQGGLYSFECFMLCLMHRCLAQQENALSGTFIRGIDGCIFFPVSLTYGRRNCLGGDENEVDLLTKNCSLQCVSCWRSGLWHLVYIYEKFQVMGVSGSCRALYLQILKYSGCW